MASLHVNRSKTAVRSVFGLTGRLFTQQSERKPPRSSRQAAVRVRTSRNVRSIRTSGPRAGEVYEAAGHRRVACLRA